MGLAALVIIFGLRLLSPRIPGALVVLVLGIAASKAIGLDTYGVSVVGEIATGIGRPGLPDVPVSTPV